MWTPITFSDLEDKILNTEWTLTEQALNFWQLIKIEPEKWKEQEYGEEGGGFWVVAIFGRQVIWYNDIEDGFNVSEYNEYGSIAKYGAAQTELYHVVGYLHGLTQA